MRNINKLLNLASLFYNKASALTKHADAFRFKKELENYLNLSIDKDQLNNWLEINKSILENKIDLYWVYNTPGSGMTAHIRQVEKNNKQLTLFSSIKNNKNPPPDMHVIEESLLIGNEGIPNLWIFTGIFLPIENKFDIDMSHNEYLVDAIQRLTGIGYTENELKEIAYFINNNKSKINRLKNMFSGSQPTYLGGGDDGVVYAIGPDHILKLFKEKYSYEEAIKAIKRLHESPELARTEAMIYDAGFIGNIRSIPIYYYLMERMVPAESKNKKLNTYLKAILNSFKKYIRSLDSSEIEKLKQLIENKESDQVRSWIKDKSSDMANIAKNNLPAKIFERINENMPELNKNWLDNLAEEVIVKVITGRGDLHLGNLGITNITKNFRYFDPAHPNWTDTFNLPDLPIWLTMGSD